jgi:hypothetical protein
MDNEDNTTKPESYSDMIAQQIAMQEAMLEGPDPLAGAKKFFAGLPLESLGLAKSTLVERGPATFFQETFGKKHEGEVNIPLQTILDDPELSKYLTNMEQVSQNNEVTAFNDYVQELSDKYKITDIPSLMIGLDEDEKNRFLELNEAAQDKSAQTYVFNEDDETVTLRSDLFPEVAFEPDVKFTKKGDISFPYLGLYGTNEAGEFSKKFSSAFKPFDKSEEGLGQYSEYIPEFMKSYQNYAMPEYSPEPELFFDPGYQAAGILTLIKGAYPIGKSIVKRITGGQAPKNTIKQEPFFEINTPWSQ